MIDARKLFLRKMTKIGFLHFTNAPTDEAMRALPDVDGPTNERRAKTVVFFHDESTFMSNEDQPTQWGMKGEKMLKPKSKGAGIMVSDFVDEHNGFLALNDSEYEAAKASNPRIRKYAREFLEYGESKEGYWTRDRFIAQMNRAVEISEIKYPKEDGWRHVWVFDHSSCHVTLSMGLMCAKFQTSTIYPLELVRFPVKIVKFQFFIIKKYRSQNSYLLKRRNIVPLGGL